MREFSGSCLCGDIGLTIKGEALRVGICHCMDCRKHHGALFHASAIFDEQSVKLQGKTHQFQGRHFCPRCGSSVFSCSPGEIEIHLGIMDEPDQFLPQYELWTIRRESWLPPFDVSERFEKDRCPET
ncbi:GFA family protein [Aestuariispira insulae]|uniref:CENP-V/GFA domain-containing protein n=1 Tax=Aestuariispira insulae TaxID=1461337 RepID=A0A3D9HUT6_9PROT|nr:GFA family protein [Aestuariispira insulae]RED53227.1 hypothetical protein DFP90_1019 [Aestuariispira insulae]